MIDPSASRILLAAVTNVLLTYLARNELEHLADERLRDDLRGLLERTEGELASGPGRLHLAEPPGQD